MLKTRRSDSALSTHFSFQPASESVKCPARAAIAKSRARHVHAMALNLLTSRRSPLIKPRTTDKSLHFRSSFRKQKRFSLALQCANAVYNVIQSLKDILSIKIFCKDIHESLKYVDEHSELKKNDEIQKEHTALSLSLSLSIYRNYAKCRTKADAHDEMVFQYIPISLDIVRSRARIQGGGGGQGVRTPILHLKNHKKHRIS